MSGTIVYKEKVSYEKRAKMKEMSSADYKKFSSF